MPAPDVIEIRFDEDGHVDPDGERALHDTLDRTNPTDLLIFSHGWNNDPATARRLYDAFFGRVDSVLASHGAPGRNVAYLGVFWPSLLWSDEPIPDFSPGAVVDLGAGAGPGAGFGPPQVFDPPPPPDAELQQQIRAAFPADVADSVAELLTLIEQRPDSEAELHRARELVQTIAASAGPAGDGERDAKPPSAALADPRNKLFEEFAAALEELHVDTGEVGGAAGFGDALQRLWHGAQEVLRGMTYWQMKNRAGVVGEVGLGPLIGRLRTQHADTSISLIGHSFGARVVSYSLKGLAVPNSVKAVTLLQGAFSHFAFADTLPMDQNRSGALNGQQAKVIGPVTACYSKFDSAVGVMYPLASGVKGDDAAALVNPAFRFGGMGHDGHQQGVEELGLLPPGQHYDFNSKKLVNIDAQRVVRNGKPPSGAHSDIIYDELAWVVVDAAGLGS